MEHVSYHSSGESLRSLIISTTQVPFLCICLLVYGHATQKAPSLVYMFAFFPSTLRPSFPSVFLCSLSLLFFNIITEISEIGHSWWEHKAQKELQLAKSGQQAIKEDRLKPEITKAHGEKK